MARINVNPTRMELKKLKARLKTAVRGHKLLKDKSDEMIRKFSVIIKENKRLRDEADRLLSDSLKRFAEAKGLISDAEAESAFMMPSFSIELKTETENIMNIDVPKLSFEKKERGGMPYAYAMLTSEADYSVEKITEALTVLAELAAVEKKTEMLADEIVRTKRRVNALEYVMIPQLEETIHYIAVKLDENERGALTRLIKVKAMIADRK